MKKVPDMWIERTGPESHMLIATKLHPPFLKAKTLPRKHLVDRLSKGKDRRLIVISGVAGSGKTSLVCQWIVKDELPIAWYSLDESDNDPDVFFRYLLASLSALDGRLATVLEPWTKGQRILPGPEFVSRLIEVLADFPGERYLVLDDYHVITSAEVHDFMLTFLDRAPPGMHVVIVSRYAVPLPLARFKIRNQIVEISSEDMKLSHKETERFFTEIVRVKITPGQIQELTRLLEGWVGGLQLFGLCLKDKETAKGLGDILNRTCREASDYLIDEVLGAQPEKVRAFLQATCLLERFDAGLCREVTGFTDASEILEHAYRNNLFLIPLDGEQKWYRYHHLFSKAVSARVRSSSPERVSRILQTAALWFARNDYLEDAFRHAFASDDLEFAADMLEDHLLVLYKRNEIGSFRRWLSRLPHRVFIQRALLRLQECYFKIESVQLSDVSAVLTELGGHRDEVFARYEGAKRKLCDDLLLLLETILPCLSDPGEVDIEKFQRSLGPISHEKTNLSGIMSIVVPSTYFHHGKMPRALEALKDASAAVFASGSPLIKMIWFRMMATVERLQGHLCRSEAILKEAFFFLDRNGLSGSHLRFMLYLPMAWILYMRDRLDKASEYVGPALRWFEQSRLMYEIADANYLLSLIHLAHGETEKITVCIRRMEWATKGVGSPGFMAQTDAFIVRLWLAQGNLRETERWANRRGLVIEEPFSLHFVFECIACSGLLFLKGRHQEASGMLETLRSRCISQNMMGPVLEIDLLGSANSYALRDRSRARMLMVEALGFCEREGYVRPFVDRAKMISPILLDLSTNPPKGADLRSLNAIMKACRIIHFPTGEGDGLPGIGMRRLTRRETEILELISAGHSDREIAEKLFISLHTAKTHTRHILRKLGLKKRLQTVRWADELRSPERLH
jgi:LuxR family maltose regulon positive regulatory protein